MSEMEYKEIVAVTGEPGLFQLVSSKGDGAIVRTLDGETTRFVPSRNHNFTPLESIEVFTTGTNVALSDVFRAMQEQEGTQAIPDPAAGGDEIRGYFRQIFPSLDEERVYMSDMKKMLKWYPQLRAHDLLHFPEEESVEQTAEETPEETAGETEVKTAEAEKTPQPAKEKKEAPAKEAPKEKTTREKTGGEKAPAAPKAEKQAAKSTAKSAKSAAKPTAKSAAKPAPKTGKKEAPKKTKTEKS